MLITEMPLRKSKKLAGISFQLACGKSAAILQPRSIFYGQP